MGRIHLESICVKREKERGDKGCLFSLCFILSILVYKVYGCLWNEEDAENDVLDTAYK